MKKPQQDSEIINEGIQVPRGEVERWMVDGRLDWRKEKKYRDSKIYLKKALQIHIWRLLSEHTGSIEQPIDRHEKKQNGLGFLQNLCWALEVSPVKAVSHVWPWEKK